MYRKSECVAMLLAGGQGSRLYALTERTAKACRQLRRQIQNYRLPDVQLRKLGDIHRRCAHAVSASVLNEYIGHGSPWDLDRAQSGVTVLPPYQAKSGGQWYKGHGKCDISKPALYRPLRSGLCTCPVRRPYI